MSQQPPDDSSAGARPLAWSDLLQDLAEKQGPSARAISSWVVTHIPEGFREVPDFRMPPELKRDLGNKRHSEIRNQIHAWRLANDLAYRTMALTTERESSEKVQGGWGMTMVEAERFYEELEHDAAPASIRTRLRGIITMLGDDHIRPVDKAQANRELAQMQAEWETREVVVPEDQERREQEAAARSMSIADLVKTVRNAGTRTSP